MELVPQFRRHDSPSGFVWGCASTEEQGLDSFKGVSCQGFKGKTPDNAMQEAVCPAQRRLCIL